ncbi:MAG TPA: hypothetical protein PK467_19405, partial [Candidatus Wallbacteria bacterium]|nr:hypothetical protein [Candidatus Wallbacteria bacterium]
MKKNGTCEPKYNKGMMIPLVLALIFLLALIVWPLNNYMRHERNLVARMRYSAITDKMAISAANEACAWFNCCVLNLHALLDAPPASLSRAEKAVMAPVMEPDIEGLRGILGEKELHSFDIIKESGGRLNSVEFYYSGFKNYFKDNPSSDYENSCYIPADPFERTGGLMISASVSYRGITRVFTTRYEIKITNTLPPVVSAFTFFTRSRNPLSSENSLVMEGATSPSRWHLGPQGIIYENQSASSSLAVPLIMVHHPDDIAVIDGYCPNHEKIREYLPPDPSVTPVTANSYRPSMDGRGWVYFGAEPTQAYIFNISPGNANPQA